MEPIRRISHAEGVHIRAREDGQPSRTIAGYAIVFNQPSEPLYVFGDSEDREVIAPEAVDAELLSSSDILMTLFHDRTLILARSRDGEGTLRYGIDSEGVTFEFEAPETADGDKALALVGRGDITGCSFAFSTYYSDPDFVSVSTEERDGRLVTLHTVRRMTGIYDFTLTPDPAYPDTSCEVRGLLEAAHRAAAPQTGAEAAAQIREMREAAAAKPANY